MPLTARDRRTLTIGGVVLAVLLVGFLVMNVLTGPGGDEALPSLPPITVPPDTSPGQVSPSPTGVSPIPIFTGRDPFSPPPALVSPTVTTPPPPDGNGTQPPTTTPPTTPPTNGNGDGTPPPTQPGGGSSEVVGGKTVALLSVFSRGGEPMVQVAVDGRVFDNVAIGETFDDGRYELRSVSGNCATFLFGDESFTLCAVVTK